jgi:hypothetical protein
MSNTASSKGQLFGLYDLFGYGLVWVLIGLFAPTRRQSDAIW